MQELTLKEFTLKEINLLKSLPQTKRNVQTRMEAKNPEIIAISKQYGEMYFDGPRTYGYGGYKYDGRWIPVAKDIITHFNLKPGDRVLDVGCAKGFLVKDLLQTCPGLEAFGLDISKYALLNCEPETVGRLHLGSADSLPFPDNSFACVLAINVIHNLPRERALQAIKEVQRVSNGRAYIQVDAYHTQEQKQQFEDWVLTAEFHDYPAGWFQLFNAAGYTGWYCWTIV